MWYVRKRAVALSGLLMILLVALLAVVWIAGRADAPSETVSVLSETEITQRAIALAQNDFVGTPSGVQVSQSTIGETGVVQCSALGKSLSILADSLRGRPNWCAPDSTLWVVSLRGEFQREGFVTDSVQIVLDRAGRMMSMDSGELTSITW
jgi:hypothetical protein